MCGICGYIGEDKPGLLQEMTESMAHRGPDDHGYFERGEIHLGHRRLSVIDVASAAPMTV